MLNKNYSHDLISVIIPVYNVEKYVSACLESVIGQTYTNLQILIIDDGSADNSGIICDEYSNRDNRIEVIHKNNGGLSDARNTGIENANGKYLIFIDSDDYIHPDAIKILYENLLKTESAISIGQFTKVTEMDFTAHNIGRNAIKVFSNIESLDNLYNDLYGQTVVAWNKLYSRKIIGDIRFPAGRFHEDEYTSYRFLYNADKVVYTEQVLYYYRQRESSIMSTPSFKKTQDLMDAHKEKIDFFIKATEETLLKKEINVYLHHIINAYLLTSDLAERKLLKNCYKKEYLRLFKKRGFPIKKRIRFKTFCYCTGLYTISTTIYDVLMGLHTNRLQCKRKLQ